MTTLIDELVPTLIVKGMLRNIFVIYLHVTVEALLDRIMLITTFVLAIKTTGIVNEVFLETLVLKLLIVMRMIPLGVLKGALFVTIVPIAAWIFAVDTEQIGVGLKVFETWKTWRLGRSWASL